MKKKLSPKQQVMQQMLQDVIDQFSPNPYELRSVNDSGRCLYFPSEDKPLSAGCAIGMYLPWELKGKIPEKKIENVLKNKFCPAWLREVDEDFLIHIQGLHDTDECWSEVGLSKLGRYFIFEICVTYGLSYSDLKFYKAK